MAFFKVNGINFLDQTTWPISFFNGNNPDTFGSFIVLGVFKQSDGPTDKMMEL